MIYAPWSVLFGTETYAYAAVVGWAPREGNREADALAKGDVDEFNPAYELMWNVLHEALEARRAAEREYQSGEEAEAAKARRRAQSGGSLVCSKKFLYCHIS